MLFPQAEHSLSCPERYSSVLIILHFSVLRRSPRCPAFQRRAYPNAPLPEVLTLQMPRSSSVTCKLHCCITDNNHGQKHQGLHAHFLMFLTNSSRVPFFYYKWTSFYISLRGLLLVFKLYVYQLNSLNFNLFF